MNLEIWHRVATLVSCSVPSIGAHKLLFRVLHGCASILSPLDDIVAGRESKYIIMWSESTVASFHKVQKALANHKSIMVPRPSDLLWIVTDISTKHHGLDATLYITRDGRTKLSGFFSAKLRVRQLTWKPCEIELLAIAVAIKHVSPYIVQSQYKTIILTDSKPYVQAFEMLHRGEFSASRRVLTFLSTVSIYQISVKTKIPRGL